MPRSYRLPPIQNLIAFEAVARLGSGSLAANELSVTPSAISHRIRQLEDSLSEVLLNRTSSEFTLTSKGAEYLDVVRASLEALNRYPIGTVLAGPRPQLRIASPPTFARQLLVPRIAAFQALQPELNIVVQVSVPFVGLKSDEADVEVRFGSGYYNGLSVEPILDEPVFPACSPEFLQREGPFDGPEAIALSRLLRCPLEPWRPWFTAANLDQGEPTEGVQFIDVGLMVEAAIHGQGIALVRHSMCEPWLKSGALVLLSGISAPGQYAYYTTWQPASPQISAIEAFVTWLKAEFA